MNTIPQIYIAAAVTTVLSLAGIGGVLIRRSPSRERPFLCLLIILMLPMSALAFYKFRLPLDSWLSGVLEKESELYQFLRVWYAPLTEEPAKLWPLLIPWIYRRIKSTSLVRVAIAIGLGFGIGEAWTIAGWLAKNPAVAKYSWYMLSGFINERFIVCITHAAFTAVALHFIMIRGSVIKGMSTAMLLHFLSNFPLYLAQKDFFGLSKDVWQILLGLWISIYIITAVVILVYFAYGNDWLKKMKNILGEAKCPECGITYQRPMFARINLFHKSFERCPVCKHWHLVNVINRMY